MRTSEKQHPLHFRYYTTCENTECRFSAIWALGITETLRPAFCPSSSVSVPSSPDLVDQVFRLEYGDQLANDIGVMPTAAPPLGLTKCGTRPTCPHCCDTWLVTHAAKTNHPLIQSLVLSCNNFDACGFQAQGELTLSKVQAPSFIDSPHPGYHEKLTRHLVDQAFPTSESPLGAEEFGGTSRLPWCAGHEATHRQRQDIAEQQKQHHRKQLSKQPGGFSDPLLPINLSTLDPLRHICPQCDGPAKIRTSTSTHPLLRRFYADCSNTDSCGHSFIMMMEIQEVTGVSRKPRPGLGERPAPWLVDQVLGVPE